MHKIYSQTTGKCHPTLEAIAITMGGIKDHKVALATIGFIAILMGGCTADFLHHLAK